MSYAEKEIYAYRKYCIYKYNGNIIRALYWKLKNKYYTKKHMQEFMSK